MDLVQLPLGKLFIDHDYSCLLGANSHLVTERLGNMIIHIRKSDKSTRAHYWKQELQGDCTDPQACHFDSIRKFIR